MVNKEEGYDIYKEAFIDGQAHKETDIDGKGGRKSVINVEEDSVINKEIDIERHAH